MDADDPTIQVPHSPAPPEEIQELIPGDLLARGMQTPQPTGASQAFTTPTPEELSDLLPQYRIEKLIGRGGMGAVYKGYQPALERPVAIKVLPAEFSEDAEFVARFQREARTLASLQHPGIVGIYGFGQTGEGHLYFVMEFVDGTDLSQIIRSGVLEPMQTLELTVQICEALRYAHGQGVIHRDIKPANILVTKEGRARLADFGLARPVMEDQAALTVSGIVMGTPAYMAPEQHEGFADHRVDIYALGVVLYEMLTGTRPEGIFAPPSVKVKVDVRLDQVVIKAMQEEPERRYQQISELEVDVDRIRHTPTPKAKSPVVKPLRPPIAPPKPVIKKPAPKKPVPRESGEKARRPDRSSLFSMLAMSIPPLVIGGYFAWTVIRQKSSQTSANQNPSTPKNVEQSNAPPVSPPPKPDKPTSPSTYPYGKPAPEKKGFVRSPYGEDAGMIDVRDYAPGTKVRDPYTNKIFLVP